MEVLDNVEAWPLADIDVGTVPTDLTEEAQHVRLGIRLGLNLRHQGSSRFSKQVYVILVANLILSWHLKLKKGEVYR